MPTEESSKENDRKCEKAANQEAQEAEVEGLKEMYPTQLTVHVPKWNVWYPTDCHLRLRPHDSCFLDGDPSKKHDFSITLHVKCSAEYPERKPFIELLEPHGLSQDQVKTLLAMLQKESAENEGLVVIGALAYTATEFLTDLSPRAAGSFHDHMLANNAKIEAEKNRKRHDTERKDLEQIEEEMNNRVPEKLPEAEPRTEAETKSIGGRRIVMLSNIPVNRSKPHNYCSEWFGFYENSQLLITEWAFRYNCTTNADQSKTRDFRPFFEKLETTTAMIAGLCGINNGDRNLVQYEFVEVEKRIVTDYSVEILLYVGQKVYATERNMSTASEVFSSQPNLMRTLAAQALFALRSLHDATLSHTHLAINSVWMSGGVDNCGFRFSDYGSLGPLLELSKMFSEISTKKTVNEEDISPKNGKDRRKQDCFQLGTMLDTLLIASQQNSSVYPDPLHSQQSRAGQILLADFINACQEAKNTDDLMNHEYLHKEQVSEIHVQLYAPFGDEMPREGRLRSEFVVLRMLGKGGFGDVVLVRNKLDMTDYAVKRIPFDNSNEKGNRRTIREAKHIAQLNHPNMVRYFNTWVEECAPRRESSSEDDECAVPIPGKEKEKKKKLKPAKSLELPSAELGNGDSMLPANLQKLVVIPQSKGAVAKEWSASYFGNAERSKCGARHSKAPSVLDTFSDDLTEEDEEAKSDEIDWDAPSEEDEEEEEISDDSDEEVEDEEEDDDDGSERRRSTGNDSVFNRSSTADDDDIVFFAASTDPKRKIEKEESEEVQKPIESRSRETDLVVRNPRVLCIQMEYCDKSTLRHCIDSNQLINDRAEAWRIFAELLCGLQYLHSSRIIHRDIKPLNIFLTSQNGVKIGDFGLATVVPLNPKKKKLVSGTEKSNSSEALLSPQKVKKNKETQQTKDVGTQLYMAPELFGDLSTNDEEKYDFKVDIYSAGVVLFEMFYRPLPSGMERVSTLNALRDKLEIPADFGKVPQQDEKATEVVRQTVQLMMARNPEHRPSAEFLLNDDDLPMHTKEDNTFKRLCGKVIKRRDGRMNGWILEQQFKEDVPTAVNYLYDVDMCQERQKYNYREALVETVREEFCKILKVHAFEKVATHTLIPVSTAMAVASVNTKPVEFLDRSGIPVALPMDLRQNFVRYCVRNSIQRLKRFNFGRVYSLNASNLHPKEKWECSVDCIGPQSSSTSLEAELLHIASEMVTTSLPKLKLTLKIGHSYLIEAQIRHLKLTDDARYDLLDLLHLFSVSDKTISQKEKHEQLAAKVTEKTASQFFKLMPIAENNFNSFKEKVNAARKKLNASANELALKAIKELEEIVKLFKFCRNEELQKLEIIYDANLCYRPRTFADGLVFQVQAEKVYSGGKKGRKCTVLAGGRYDSALLRERRPRDFVYRFPLCISGFGVNMDKMALMREISCKTMAMTEKCPTQGKVLICSKEQPNGSNLIQEKFRLAKKFWNVGIQADVFHNPVDKLESLNDHRVRASITHIVALTNENLEAVISTSSGFHKVNFEQILQSVCRDTQSLVLQNTHQTPNGPSGTATTPGESGHEDHSTPVIATRASRSASASHVSGSLRASSATVANLNVIFAMSGDRYHKFIKEKKRVENQVSTHLADFVTQFSSKTKIEVIVVDVSIDIIKRIVGDITKTSSTTEFEAVFDSLAQSRVDLTQLKKQLHSTLHGSSSGFGAGHVVILYRNADNFYRCLT